MVFSGVGPVDLSAREPVLGPWRARARGRARDAQARIVASWGHVEFFYSLFLLVHARDVDIATGRLESVRVG